MPRLSYSKRNALRQAIDMQAHCYKAAQLLAQDLQATSDKEERARVATALGNLVRNWSALQESVRVLKGDPLPGSLKPSAAVRAKRPRTGPGREPIPYGLIPARAAPMPSTPTAPPPLPPIEPAPNDSQAAWGCCVTGSASAT